MSISTSFTGRLRSIASGFLIAGLVLIPRETTAQGVSTLTGRVTDSQTGQPLSGARVTLPGALQGTITRSDGTYRLPVTAGRHAILVTNLGYSPRRDTVDVAAGQTVSKDYSLEKGLTQLDPAVIVGTRAAQRTVLNSPVPVDVLTPKEIQQTGLVETSQIIQMLAPSFNFPRPTVADGTDHIRPSTLRGLGPDQVLVLVNGKRRHTTSLVNVNGTVGRGSTGVDLNAIPAASIDRIEILRDGAAAQYGSDAIAGVINIILKSDASTDLETQVGRNYTTLRALGNSLKLRDGDVTAVSANTGANFRNDGFVHVTGEWEHRGSTNRSLQDKRTQYFAGDPKNTDPLYTNQIHFRQGDAIVNDIGFVANAGLPAFSSGAQVYAFTGISHRKGQSAGNWRLPNGNNTVRAIWPDGFLPFINSTIGDISGTVGVKGESRGWQYDLSGGYGRNKFDFDITNTNNATMGAASPTQFYAGSLKFGQAIANFDITRGVPESTFGMPLNVAIGAEARRDSYGIDAGEPDSYRDGGFKVLDGPNIGAQPTPGAQVFAGFQPGDAGSHNRTSFAGYLDFEMNPFEAMQLGLAGRSEHYSDFGSATIGKVSARYELLPAVAIRGAFNTGFRAPSLGQEFFSSTATNFLNLGAGLVPVEIRTLPVTSGAAVALGAEPLRPEKSKNFGYGLTVGPLRNLSLTVDRYEIAIDDRIVFSGNFTGAAMTNFLASQGFPGVGSARFFTNAIDTRTKGLDIVGRYSMDFGTPGITRFTGGYNHTGTKVKRVSATPPALSAQQSILFDRLERARIEEGQPQTTVSLTLDHTVSRFDATLHTTRFGEVGARGQTNPALDQKYGAKWVTDANLSARLLAGLKLTVGANNIGDVYPDENIPLNNNSGIFPYNGISPFGFNGRFVYVRARWER
ncbi:MAG TPA: TonB-dependent receptor [Gemmatimonadaceae bacterium]|nr:TonB-dependent receptor [Gemmatimonadaceae bacterium]